MAKRKKKAPAKVWPKPLFDWAVELWTTVGSSEILRPEKRQTAALVCAIWNSACGMLPRIVQNLGFCRDTELESWTNVGGLSHEKRASRQQQLIQQNVGRMSKTPADHVGGTPLLAEMVHGLDPSLTNIALGMMLAEVGIEVAALIHCDRNALIGRLADGRRWYVDARENCCGEMWLDRKESEKISRLVFDRQGREALGIHYGLGLGAPLVQASVWHMLKSCALYCLHQLEQFMPHPSTATALSDHPFDREHTVPVKIVGNDIVALLKDLFPEIMANMLSNDFEIERTNITTLHAMNQLLRQLTNPSTGQPFADSTSLYADALESLTGGTKPLLALSVIIDGVTPPAEFFPTTLTAYLAAFGRELLKAGPTTWLKLHPLLVQKLYDRQLREASDPTPPPAAE